MQVISSDWSSSQILSLNLSFWIVLILFEERVVFAELSLRPGALWSYGAPTRSSGGSLTKQKSPALMTTVKLILMKANFAKKNKIFWGRRVVFFGAETLPGLWKNITPVWEYLLSFPILGWAYSKIPNHWTFHTSTLAIKIPLLECWTQKNMPICFIVW